MTLVTCKTCLTVWNAEIQADCPKCKVQSWLNNPNLIAAKHDPNNLPSAYPAFRSVISPDIMTNLNDNLEFAACSGTAFYSQHHRKYCQVVTMPSGVNAGSAIPSGNMMPTTELDSLVIADSTGKSHLFADNEHNLLNQIQQGKLQQLSRCITHGCSNLSIPNNNKCAKHITPPLAD